MRIMFYPTKKAIAGVAQKATHSARGVVMVYATRSSLHLDLIPANRAASALCLPHVRKHFWGNTKTRPESPTILGLPGCRLRIPSELISMALSALRIPMVQEDIVFSQLMTMATVRPRSRWPSRNVVIIHCSGQWRQSGAVSSDGRRDQVRHQLLGVAIGEGLGVAVAPGTGVAIGEGLGVAVAMIHAESAREEGSRSSTLFSASRLPAVPLARHVPQSPPF